MDAEFAVAGFWQQVGDKRCFAMVTYDPNELVAPILPKAMIMVLEAADRDTWLRGSYQEAVGLQRPYDAKRMTVRGAVPDAEVCARACDFVVRGLAARTKH